MPFSVRQGFDRGRTVQELTEPGVGVRIRRQVICQKRSIDLGSCFDLNLLVAHVDRHQTDDKQHQQRDQRRADPPGRAFGPAAAESGLASTDHGDPACAVALRREVANGACTRDCKLAGDAQALLDVVRDRKLIERSGDLARDLGLPTLEVSDVRRGCGVHVGEIPLAFRAFASECTALEQCVLTLPSEHPMAAAVSATSSSSQ